MHIGSIIGNVQVSMPLSALFSNNLALLLLGGACAFLLSYVLTFAVIAIAHKLNWYDRSTAERKREHAKAPVPRLGGIAMFLAFVIASLIFYQFNPELDHKEFVIYWLLLASATLTVIVNVYDDIKGMKPLPKFIAQTVAVLLLMGPYIDAKFHGVLLFGFSNPFGARVDSLALHWYQRPEITLFIHPAPGQFPAISLLAVPAVLFTWFWMVGMMNTINWIDGMDGLATGIVGITAFFIAVISWTLNQHTIAILAIIFTGAVIGFLPHNWNPAKIIMGDSGSQFLGLTLATLSIMGGAKIALALMVLGIPILDVAVVMINRVRRGQRPWHYDTTHLHQRLRATGWTVRQICYVIYSLMIFFGVLALVFKHVLKFVGLGLVVATMAGLIFWIDYSQRHGGGAIKLGGPDPEPPAPTETPLPEAPVKQLDSVEEVYAPLEEGKRV
ncbi:MAG: undecaprenyl/decaprenyl-phosphate alpha-N-acetylglucosaminyl 1-phosphate transferase [Ktedonobacteraceae bacterium]|nr:undecaprenyl/decaprenyl-phosphate alpha-N-acetylglucosaminyl 1-phosphate transferase [Ktedonobacteraceae bacterium]